MNTEISSNYILTDDQLNNHFKVYAGPGAGKTYFLVQNIKNIITRNKKIIESKSRKLACITYTNSAVDIIKNRLGRHSALTDVNTIHGFIIENIIKPFQTILYKVMLDDFQIDANGTKPITSQIEGLHILHGEDKELIYDYIMSKHVDSIIERPDYSKKSMGEVEVDIDNFYRENLKVLAAKNKTIKSNHYSIIKEYIWSKIRKLTHDEILYFGLRILQESSIALYSLRVKFPFIFVDEFQDTSPLQSMLLKLIGQNSTIIGVIGDVAQSIYSFQGARPSQFSNFQISDDTGIQDFTINGNRRSTNNIISFCNFIRKEDGLLQVSNKPYDNVSDEDRLRIEAQKIHLLIGNGNNVNKILQLIIANDGIVLTRTWASAFEYVQGVEESQSAILKTIYNSYFNSPIDIRNDIVEQNNVTWVRAFRFILTLFESFKNGSLIDVLKALKLYIKEIDMGKITPKALFQLKNLSIELYRDFQSFTTVELINKFNAILNDTSYEEFKNLLGDNFQVSIFNELDKDDLVKNVSSLSWATSMKLFNDIFTTNSKYMTVHQAKGMEWNRVIVSVNPTRNDGQNKSNDVLNNMFCNPLIKAENPEQEFTRIFYVACSRAIEDLYIHIQDPTHATVLVDSLNRFVKETHAQCDYEIIKD